MKELKEDLKTVSENTQSLVKAEAELMQLKFIEESSSIISFAFSRLVFTAMIVIGYAILVIAAGFYFNQFFDGQWQGMGIAGMGSLILTVVAYLIRKALIEYPVQDYIIQKFSNRFEL